MTVTSTDICQRPHLDKSSEEYSAAQWTDDLKEVTSIHPCELPKTGMVFASWKAFVSSGQRCTVDDDDDGFGKVVSFNYIKSTIT